MKSFLFFIGLFFIVGFTGCSKARKAEGAMDTPQAHYQQGMKYWDNGEYKKAEEEFKLSKSLDPKYAPAISGLALVTAQKAKTADDKDKEKELFKEALKLADEAKSKNDKIPEVYIAKAIVITMMNEGKKPAKDWIDKVEKEYEKAIKIDPQNSEAYYRRGVCYKKALMFKEAGADFKKVLDLNKEFTEEADREWETIQKIERAAPGTEVGKKIALIDKISRADIAALFVTELNIEKLIEKRRKPVEETEFKAPDDPRELKADSIVSIAKVTDIDNHWAKNFIEDIVNISLRGLEPYPDHTFRPDDLITRAEFAMMIEDILVAITGDESITTKYIGEDNSRFPDVNKSHPAYNSICNAVDRNILDAYANGKFNPQGTVSGPEALLAIRKIKELNKI